MTAAHIQIQFHPDLKEVYEGFVLKDLSTYQPPNEDLSFYGLHYLRERTTSNNLNNQGSNQGSN